jgi:hypothetical protein
MLEFHRNLIKYLIYICEIFGIIFTFENIYSHMKINDILHLVTSWFFKADN